MGSARALHNQKIDNEPLSSATAWAPERVYTYIGHLHLHFGHFLINTFPRLWWAADGNSEMRVPLLCHCGAAVSNLPDFEFIGEILGLLDIEIADIHAFEAPMRVSCVETPATALHEQFAVHTILRDLALKAAAKLSSNSQYDIRDEPIYVSKTRLKRGVGIFEGENILEDEARSRGYRIIYPETMSFAEQVKALSEHRVITGTVGSGFHTLLFCPPGKRLVGLNAGPDVNSNFGLIDRISGVHATYFAPRPDLVDHISGTEVLTTHRLLDPQAVARDYFAEVEKAWKAD